MSTQENTIYRQEVRIDATPDTVFDFLVDAEAMVRWIGIATTADARPGGELMIDMNGHDIVRGEFQLVDRPRHVVFTWGYEGSADMAPGSSTVDITLEPDGVGTLLILTHHDCAPHRLDDHAGGWRHFLGRLAQEASTKIPNSSEDKPKETT